MLLLLFASTAMGAACTHTEPRIERRQDALTNVGEVLTWRQVNRLPLARNVHAGAFDTARGRFVVFGGSQLDRVFSRDTWEWDGNGWNERTPVVGNPPGRLAAAVAYDAARGRTVLFGGEGASGRLSDTWEWNGTAWTNVTPAGGSPPGRVAHAMAYDSGRQRVVMFGGGGGGLQGLSDTWEWDGAAWTERSPATGPSGRAAHAMAYDAVRSRVVLYGGEAQDGTTWEWDGAAWTAAAPPSAGPGSRYWHSMAFDSARGRVLLFGGTGESNEILAWDGATWQATSPSGPAPERTERAAMAFDPARGRTILFGGSTNTAQYDNQTWEWDGAAWARRAPSAIAPPIRFRPGAVYDEARSVFTVFGGLGAGFLDDTWAWNGSTWNAVTPPSGNPSPRAGHAMAFDAERAQVVLFGGGEEETTKDDTWVWNGAAWSPRPVGLRPSPRTGHAMTYDAKRQRVVLFGGNAEGPRLSDTWEWDGSAWAEKTPATHPSPREGTKLIFDPKRERVVLFGGLSNGNVQDTWEWDGVDWVDRTPASGNPTPRYEHALAYDRARERVVLFGGIASGQLDDVWEWDGAAWTDMTPLTESPSGRAWSSMAYDTARNDVVLFGDSEQADTWLLSARGGACTGPADSTTGSCVDGVSCESSQCASCEACNVPGAFGTCAPVTLAVDRDTCEGALTCDRQGTCKAALGQAVAAAAECASGFLVDGVCCETEACGPCQTCSAANKEIPDNDGRCGTQRGGTDLHDDCAVEAPATCGQTGLCDGRGLCQSYPTGTACGVVFCRDDVVTGEICTGAGASVDGCIDVPQGRSCAPYACDAAVGCKSSCVQDTDCANAHRCDAGLCVTKEGASCDGAHTLTAPNGAKTDCTPFNCSGDRCNGTCASASDCAGNNVCNESGTCVAPRTDQSGTDGGCACNAGTQRGPGAALVLLLALATARRRRGLEPRPDARRPRTGRPPAP